jgi:hypothetical protein
LRVSHDDPFGVPLNPPGFEPLAAGFEPLASGDESVLAASGLVTDPAAPRNKTALIALGLAIVLGAVGIAFATGAFRSTDKPLKVAVKPSPSVSASASPTPSASASAKPKPKPAPLKPIAGTPQAISKANSGTLGPAYTVTVPTKWTVVRGVRSDRVANVDLRMRNAEKTHSLTIATIKPAVATGKLTPAGIAAIKVALLKGDPAAKPLPGTPRVQVAGAAATGYDVRTTSAGKPITIRTIVWQRGATIYAATWRVPGASFARSLTTFSQLLAAVKYAK